MITRTSSRWQTTDWQSALKSMIRSKKALCDYLELTPEALGYSEAAQDSFSLKVTQSYLDRIEKANPKDPLLLQILPHTAEMIEQPGFSPDPLEEKRFNPAPGLIHKYHGRVLLITNPSCAIHCRYCFRRHFPYEANTPSTQQWQAALNYIREHSDITEIILSGGDPLSSNDKYLKGLLDELETIGHVKYLRIHTRLPVVLPQRVTNELLDLLDASRLKATLVFHINHANELSDEVIEAAQLFQRAGMRVLNQAVLLKGINASEEALQALFTALHDADIQAYYLHLLDPVSGASHFHINDQEALELFERLRIKLPGFMLPKLVRETPDVPYKAQLISL